MSAVVSRILSFFILLGISVSFHAMAANESRGPRSNFSVDSNTQCLNAYSDFVEENAFMVGRNFKAYSLEMHEDLLKDVAALRENQVLLDVGAGKGYALSDYLNENSLHTIYGEEFELPPKKNRAIAIGISPKIPMEGRKALGNFIKQGRAAYIEASLHEYSLKNPATVDLAMDLKAATVYSKFDQSVFDLLVLLKKNGKAFFSSENSIITRARGSVVKISDYLNMGGGFKIVNGAHVGSKEVKLIRTKGAILLPELKIIKTELKVSGPVTTYEIVPGKFLKSE